VSAYRAGFPANSPSPPLVKGLSALDIVKAAGDLNVNAGPREFADWLLAAARDSGAVFGPAVTTPDSIPQWDSSDGSLVKNGRAIGVAAATDVPDRAAADTRYLQSTGYTAADVLAKLLTVDGAGSGLDADLLDGQSGAHYLAWANQTGVPATFTPSAHTHVAADITDFNTAADARVALAVGAAPAALDTLFELAAALGNDANFAATTTALIGTKLNASAYTAADVLAKLLTVDGAGSGLDADTLDGQSSAHYLDLGNATGSLAVARIVAGSIERVKLGTFALAIAVMPEAYGAVGDGVTDDTAAFTAWAAAMSAGGTYSLRHGATYIIDAGTVYSASFITIEGNFATIKSKNGAAVDAFHFIAKFTGSYINVRNLRTDGNRANRTPIELPAFNFALESCSHFRFENCHAINAVVDGWCILTQTKTDVNSFPHHGVFKHCTADNSWRNGLSIINGHDILIDHGQYDNSNGTIPEGGIDLESDTGGYEPGIWNVEIRGTTLTGNDGVGLLVSSVGTPESIIIDDVIISGEGAAAGADGLYLSAHDVVVGSVLIHSFNTTAADTNSAFRTSTGTRVNIDKLTILEGTGDGASFKGAQMSGTIGSLIARNCVSKTFCADQDYTNLTFRHVDMYNCGSTSANGALIRLGTNCRILSGNFLSCKGHHIFSDVGGNVITNIYVDAPNVGVPTTQNVIQTRTGDTISNIIIKNPVTTTTQAIGIGSASMSPAHISNLNVRGFTTGYNIQLANPSKKTVIGSTTITPTVQTVDYQGTGGHTITMPGPSEMLDNTNYEIEVVHAGSGTLTVSGASGDVSLQPGDTIRYKANVGSVTWKALTISLHNTATYDPPVLTVGLADAIQTMTVTGAALGDSVIATFSLDLQGIELAAWVSAANTVSYQFRNPSGGPASVDLGSGTVRCRVVK
jgi:hypothetical protein